MFLLRILLSLLTTASPLLASRLLFQAGNCTPGTDFFSHFKLLLKNNAINMDMVIIKPMITGMMGHLDFELRATKAHRFQRVFQHDLNYCNTLIGVKESIFKRWFKSVLKHGNFSPICPVPPGVYYLHNWQITPDLVPSYLSIPGEYRIKGRAYYRKNKLNKREAFVLECTLYAFFQ